MNATVMFVSHKLSPTKKSFQKPNILRRKPKAASMGASLPEPPPLVPAPLEYRIPSPPQHAVEAGGARVLQTLTLELASDMAGTLGSDSPALVSVVKPEDPDLLIVLNESSMGEAEESAPAPEPELEPEPEYEHEHEQEPEREHEHEHEQEPEREHEHEQEPEPEVDVEAFLNGAHSAQYKAQYEVHTQLDSTFVQKWHIDFDLEADKSTVEEYSGASAAAATEAEAAARPAKHKCAAAGCGKAFATEQKLRRHRAVHGVRGAREARVECPARGAAAGAGGAPCGRVFEARAALAAHLRDDHRPEDAPHKCAECGRRFFWAAGLRAHARAHAAPARGALHACAWPGCGRAFRQPCRLREHARAHTGDRPYRCAHDGCGWAFRTASKLLRHARRHTGERGHACACGRAFRRREHLREHQARHRARAHPPAECATTVSAPTSADAASAAEPQPAAAPADDSFMVRLEAGAGGAEARAARTHCTWPLAQHAPDTLAEERPCAVRSDLFLAAAGGEDSQQMMAAGAGAGAGAGEGALEAAAASPLPGLGLLDLMQEELMYTDAVDESSFQVLLLSEELG